MTGFVFKIQANMDPNHRDRIAFMRVCSGKLQRGMRGEACPYRKARSRLSAPAILLRPGSLAGRMEAFAGDDVVGIPNHGLLRIGDTLSEGEEDRPFAACRASLRSGNSAPGQAFRCDEGQEAARSAANRWPKRAWLQVFPAS